VVNRQGWIQLAAGALLVISCTPFLSINSVFTKGGSLPQFMGFVFLLLLVAYMVQSFRWVRGSKTNGNAGKNDFNPAAQKASGIIFKLGVATVLVLFSSRLLIPSVLETAVRLSVPESIISATLVAFGTSLPELVTALTAVRKGYGELAVGNVIGADILNVFFVAGAAASVTSGGLLAPGQFFQTLFPAMIFILVVFRMAVAFSDGFLKRGFGMLLLTAYLVSTLINYS
jgi:cation:H+ antiporter